MTIVNETNRGVNFPSEDKDSQNKLEQVETWCWNKCINRSFRLLYNHGGSGKAALNKRRVAQI